MRRIAHDKFFYLSIKLIRSTCRVLSSVYCLVFFGSEFVSNKLRKLLLQFAQSLIAFAR